MNLKQLCKMTANDFTETEAENVESKRKMHRKITEILKSDLAFCGNPIKMLHMLYI